MFQGVLATPLDLYVYLLRLNYGEVLERYILILENPKNLLNCKIIGNTGTESVVTDQYILPIWLEMNSSLFFQKYCLYFIITSDVELLVYFFVQLILSLNSIKVNDPIMWKTVSCFKLVISWLGGFYMMDYLTVNVRKWLLSII